jgi:hypothetical protein
MKIADPLIDLINPSVIENVDFAFFDWIDRELNLFCTTKDGFKKTPVLWVSPERSFQIKGNKELRDINGALIPPFITVERTSINKDQKDKGVYFANIPPNDNRHIISRRINQKKTSEFSNADEARSQTNINFISSKKKNKKVVYEFKEMLLPVYAIITYNIEILTQYQQQMNELIQPFLARTGSTKYFLIERDGYKYECFIDGQIQTKNNTNNMAVEERKHISALTIKVLANLVSDGVNEVKKVIKTYENAVDLKLNRQKVQIDGVRAESPSNIGLIPTAGSGGAITDSQKILKSDEFPPITVNLSNTANGLTTVTHYLNSQNVQVVIREKETLINIVTNIYYYDNYIEVDGLEDGVEYLFTITG